MILTVTHFFMHASPLLIYTVIVVVLLLESSGIPIVNTSLLLFAGALASLGRLDIWLVATTAIVGSVMGACLAYYLGARGGRRALLGVTSFCHIDSRKVDLVERWFRRSGIGMVFLSRMTPYVRPFACFPAGISGMPFARFFASAFFGSVIWCTAILVVGWYLGHRWRLALHAIEHYTLPTVCVLILAIAVYLFITHKVKRSLHSHFSTSASKEKTRNGDRDLMQV